MGGLLTDWALARYLRRKGARIGAVHVLRRRSDGTLWVAGHPADFGLCMRGLFTGEAGFHFYRARIWRGLLIATPKVFWLAESRSFDVLQDQSAAVLPRWPEDVETAKIRRILDSQVQP